MKPEAPTLHSRNAGLCSLMSLLALACTSPAAPPQAGGPMGLPGGARFGDPGGLADVRSDAAVPLSDAQVGDAAPAWLDVLAGGDGTGGQGDVSLLPDAAGVPSGDGGVAVDAGDPGPDVSSADGQDGTVVDGQTADALSGLDAAADASAPPDAGPQDAGAVDAGLPNIGQVDAGPQDAGPKPECVLDKDCPKGVCINSKCCPTAPQVCGNVCCPAGHACLAGGCVKPGKACSAPSDCDAGQYCELGLGGGKIATKVAQAGQVCLHPLPKLGYCLDLPVKCPAGKPVPPDGSCVPECLWKPPAGKLDPVVEWQWGPVAKSQPKQTDVWSTPAVGRIYDSNCDGKVNPLDPPVLVFVSSDAKGTCCSCGSASLACQNGVLRMLDGATGQEIWSLPQAFAGSKGFAGLSTAIADLNGDGHLEIAALTGEGRLAVVDRFAKVLALSTQAVAGGGSGSFGWGGGLAIADMEGDGKVEIAFGATVFTMVGGKLVLKFAGKGGIGGGGANKALSAFSDLDLAANGHQELIGGNTAYRADGSQLWKSTVPDGFPAVGDFDGDGLPEVVVVASGQMWLLEGKTGKIELGPLTLPNGGLGGPPTVADFDGDGKAEIGVAMRQYYSVVKPDYAAKKLTIAWKTANHDLSSSVTGSTVFDFEGDGAAEVIYNDECFLWVYDGKTGKVRFAALTTSFTGTEASLVADVDGDGHAEMVLMSNGADPSASGWKCNVSPWNKADPANNRPAWVPPKGQAAYRGIRVFGSGGSSWVGTRSLWSQHTYHVTNICDDHDTACSAPNLYGTVPKPEKPNWKVGWLNNFRQNVQDHGIFDAPDATVSLLAACGDDIELHALVRNMGLAQLPKGVKVSFWFDHKGVVKKLAELSTQTALYPGQTASLSYLIKPADGVDQADLFQVRIELDPKKPLFHECEDGNNKSEWTGAPCYDNPLRRG